MLQAGFFRGNITPPLGTHMAGYYSDRQADGMLDPLLASCVAFRDGQENTALNIKLLRIVRFLYSSRKFMVFIFHRLSVKCIRGESAGVQSAEFRQHPASAKFPRNGLPLFSAGSIPATS